MKLKLSFCAKLRSRLAGEVGSTEGLCLAHLFAGKPAAVMTPAGRAKKIVPFLLPTDFLAGHVPADLVPFMEYDIDRTALVQRFGQTIFSRLVFVLRQFRLE